MPYTAYEPEPKSTKYYHGGIGGIGNYRKKTSLTSSLLSSPPTSLPSSTSGLSSKQPASSSTFRPFYGGRGGAGNVHAASERAIFSFDEELAKDRKAPVYSIGRGGCGNIVNEEEGEDANDDEEEDLFDGTRMNNYFERMRRMSTRSTSSRSTQSTPPTQSGADRFIRKIKNLTKHA